jgi:hypothetical protein
MASNVDLLEEVIQLSERYSSAKDACVRPAWPKAISIFLGELYPMTIYYHLVII